MANGKPWDLDRHHGGFRVIMPEQAGPPSEEGFVSGNAEELLSNRDAIRRHGADAVLVLSADHVYRLDYAEVVAEHLRRGAECTVVTTEVPLADATHHAVMIIDDDGRVRRVDYKPEEPAASTVATEVFVYDPVALIEVLEELHRAMSVAAGDARTTPRHRQRAGGRQRARRLRRAPAAGHDRTGADVRVPAGRLLARSRSARDLPGGPPRAAGRRRVRCSLRTGRSPPRWRSGPPRDCTGGARSPTA